ncbi:MAG: Mur ligase family protein [Desulfomicrobium escambiense]|nr:Mur ligase family protein [Desulfomicrobium escambiense]
MAGKCHTLKPIQKFGKGQYFIAELDESDGTIEHYKPDITVITNLEFDHPDHYKGGLEQVFDTFKNYINNLNPNSKLIINADCQGNVNLINNIKHSDIILYSIDINNTLFNKAKYTIKNISSKGLRSKATVYIDNKAIGELILNIPGLHNISNALQP